jgi:hypothetical protein
MENLIELLKKETEALKVAYVEKSNEWAKKEFEYFTSLTEQEVKEQRGYYEAKSNWPGWRHSKASNAFWGKVSNVKYNGLEAYLEKKHKEAAEHYEDSIVKLARRIVDKGLDTENLTLSTESNMQKGNISTTIKDGKGTVVRAFTILAWGEVNAPHYRYLIK